MHPYGYINPICRANYMHYYSFDVEIKAVRTPAPAPSVSALIGSRSIPKMDSRLLIASRDPPIGTPKQK